MKKHLLLIALLFAGFLPAMAQSSSTQGKEFWVSFMHNGYTDVNGLKALQITISAKRDCSGTISNPNTNWSQDFDVRANDIRNIEVPREQCYHDRNNNEVASNLGLKIVATDTISAYCANIAGYSFDASFILPTESLGEEYIVQCGAQSTIYASDPDRREAQTSGFLIVATEDNTTVDITPRASTLNGHPENVTFSVTLNAGQTYHVRSNNTTDNRDLSGTHIVAHDCKKLAVFNGNTLTHLPIQNPDLETSGFDHIYEQAMPLRSWGKKFIPTQSLTRRRDIVKVISSANGNIVKKNGFAVATLNAFESYSFFVESDTPSCFIETSQPSAVYLYNTSAYDTRANGDPSMVWIAPVEQRIDEVTFATFNHSQASIDHHYVNIIVETKDIQNVYLDGEAISPTEFSPVSGNNDYSYFRKTIRHGSHHIKCANGFNAHVYGFGDAKGYAYLVGSNAIDLSTNLIVNDFEVQNNDIFPYCIEEPVTFTAQVNYQDYDLLWDFGDGQTSTQNPATHTYHSKQIFPAMLVVNTNGSGCNASASDTTLFFVDVTQQYVDEYDTLCMGQYYSGHGFSNVLIMNDTLLCRLQANSMNPICSDSLRLHIHARPTFHPTFHEYRCWQGQPDLYEGHGFSIYYQEPGIYPRELYLTTLHGCDSIVSLTLEVSDRIEAEFDDTSCTGHYTWNDEDYTESGDYQQQFQSLQGCDSIVTLHLTIGHDQSSSFDTIVCTAFEWEGEIYDTGGTYQRHFNTIVGCDSLVTLHLQVEGTYDMAPLTISDACDSVTWNNRTYTESGYYTDTLHTALGCDSIIHLDLQLQYMPHPTPIMPLDTFTPHWVVPATEFQINSYTFYLYDENPHCRWESVQWSLSDNCEWVIQPSESQKSCEIFILENVTDTVILDARVFNSCTDTIGELRQYWLVCSFYGLEENKLDEQIDILPNPNNGEMTLHFRQVEGKISARIYDMTGQLLDNFSLEVTPMSHHYYALNRYSYGLYLFIFNHDGISTTKKVIITQ